MWAFRRASIHLKNRGLSSGTTRICHVKTERASCYLEKYNAGVFESQPKMLDGLVYSRRFYNKSSSSRSCAEICSFSSKAGAESSWKQDNMVKVAFSQLENPNDAAATGDEIKDESFFEPELSEAENELENLDTGTDIGEKVSPTTKDPSAMAKAILAAPALPASKVLDRWVQEGNEVTEKEVSLTMFYLRKRRLFNKALQLSDWLESTKHLEFTERNYASRVDLIGKVRGIFKAQEYMQQIPESSRGEIVYRALLANCVSARNRKKSEEVFNQMKNLFPLTCFSCDQLLLLYKRTDRSKIADVLSLMEKENIKQSMFSYQILIDVKGQSNNISGMEQIVEMMKSEGMEPSMQIQASLARYYAAGGLKDKAEAVLKEMEGGDIMKNRRACYFLFPIYASLGRDDEVGRIWKVCESDPGLAECMAAIEAWGKLKRIEDAEAVFEKMLKIVHKPSSKHYAVLLNVYADHNMLTKGNDLVSRMVESDVTALPVAWDALVKLYAIAGEVEKAESLLEKACKERRGRPFVTSYLTILDQYASRGDVHNAEKIFLWMRQAGCPIRIRSYHSLLYAYVNAKAPAYGFRERMEGDNLVPNKSLAGLLAQADAFMKSELAQVDAFKKSEVVAESLA